MIHIGDKWGKKYDYIRYYIPFRIKYGIKFTNWQRHGEIWKDPTMYDKPYFIPRAGDIVFDIGSQYGDYAILWEKRNKAKVYAFEILLRNWMEMQKDIQLNECGVQAYNMAIGNGENVWYNADSNMAIKAESSDFWSTTIRLDDFVKTYNIIPQIIKIDVEGFELHVLEGAKDTLQTYRPKIIIETHSKELRQKCDTFLNSLGYSLFFEGRYGNASGWMDEVVNLFYGR